MVVVTDFNKIKDFLRNKLCNNKTVLAFVGSPLRSDDRIGLIIYSDILEKIRNKHEKSRFIECEYGLENCIHEIIKKKPEILIIVDAVLSKELSPGEVVLVSWDHVREKVGLATTHNIPVYITLNMLKQETNLQEIYLLGIRVKNIDIGMEVSDLVNEARKKVNKLLLETIKTCTESRKQ